MFEIKAEISISVCTWPINAITIAIYHTFLLSFFVFHDEPNFRSMVQIPLEGETAKSIIKIPTLPVTLVARSGPNLRSWTVRIRVLLMDAEQNNKTFTECRLEFDGITQSTPSRLGTNSIFFHFISDFSSTFLPPVASVGRCPGTGRKLSDYCPCPLALSTRKL